MHRAILAIALALSVQECIAAEDCEGDVRALREMLKTEPEQLAQATASRGDIAFLMWGGVGAVIPGIANQKCAREDGQFKWMRGASSDSLCGGAEHAALYQQSSDFAVRYNRAMVTERERRGIALCAP